jgi:putative tryptophan/tyrosine transport system substrate-binding protein
VLNPGPGWSLTHLRQVAETHRITLLISDVLGPDGYDATFAATRKAKVDAVLVPSFPRFYREHLLIIKAAAKRRIPAIYEWGDMARAGGLMAYGSVLPEINKRVATYVDKILKGAKPADLPIEQPMRFELVINLKTAKALRLTISLPLFFQATEVIQ